MRKRDRDSAGTAKSESRDISAYACRAMVFGAVSGHGISRDSIERACERYSDENPRVDVTKMPLFMWTDDGTPESHAIVAMVRKWCKRCSVASEDGKTVLVVGTAAREIVSKLELGNGTVQRLKTKYRISCPFPMDRKLKCFGGERVGDHVRRTRKG